MASSMPLHDYYLFKDRLQRSQLNSNNINSAHNKVDNVAYYLEKAAEKPRFEINGNNFNFSRGSDRWSAAGTSSVFSSMQPFTMSSVSAPQQQQYNYNQQQGQSFIRQSFSSTSVPTPQQQQQQQYPKSYAFQQNNFPSNNILFNNAALSSLSSFQPPNQNQLEYSQWFQQFQPGQQQGIGQAAGLKPIERPTEIWFIGWVDILSAVLFTALAVHNIFTKPITDPDNYIWLFFIGFIDILIKLMMGFGLLTGLRSDDDFSTLWYCKLWIVCQVLFLFCSVITVMTSVLLYASKSTLLRNEELPVAVPLNLGIFFYRILCFILVRKFVGKLKKSEAVISAEAETSGYYTEQELQRQTEEAEQENRNKFGTGDSAFCGPSAALILSL